MSGTSIIAQIFISLKSGESTNGKLAIDCKSGRKLRHTQHVSPCSKYSNVFALTLCMLSNVFFVLNIS